MGRGIHRRLRRIENATSARGRFIVTCIYEGETLEEAFAIEHPGETVRARDYEVNVRLCGETRDGQLVEDWMERHAHRNEAS